MGKMPSLKHFYHRMLNDMIPTLRKKQNSELRLLESVPIWMVLRETKDENLKSGLLFEQENRTTSLGGKTNSCPCSSTYLVQSALPLVRMW